MSKQHPKLNRRYKQGGFDAIWAWLKGHGPYRTRLALHWVEDRIRNIKNRPRDKQGDLERWQVARKVYAKRLARQRKTQKPKFQRWMLNGHPGNVQAQVKRAIARVLVRHDNVYVTATTDGVHATNSYHYRGMAVDFGGTNWYSAFRSEKARGCSGYYELFGPQTGYIKNGQCLSGTSPDVPNHTHDAPIPTN